MDKTLQYILIVSTILFAIFIIYKTGKKKLNYRLTILWLCFSLFIVCLAIFPQIIMLLAKILHIETAVNALYLMFIFLLIIVLFYVSIEISKLQNKIIVLIQENALLNKKIQESKGEK